MAYRLAIANPKGGVGKTTTVINLGAALAEKGRKVLLLDFDPQGHLTIGCGLGAIYTSSDFELARFILRGALDEMKTLITRAEDFWVMPAHTSLVRLEDELLVQKAGEPRLRRLLELILELLSDKYDFCLIDSPPRISILTDAVLLAAKKVLVPIQAEDTSIYGIEALESEILEMKEYLDVDVEIVAIVPNMVSTNSVSERVLDSLLGKWVGVTAQSHKNWVNLVADFQIRRRIDLAKAWHEGKSIFSYNPHCDVVGTYRRLADFIEAKSSSFLNG
jgi:chromosome partitioning protein